jgi:hypothetical protein
VPSSSDSIGPGPPGSTRPRLKESPKVIRP